MPLDDIKVLFKVSVDGSSFPEKFIRENKMSESFIASYTCTLKKIYMRHILALLFAPVNIRIPRYLIMLADNSY